MAIALYDRTGLARQVTGTLVDTHLEWVRATDVAWFWSQVAQAAMASWIDAALTDEWSTSLEELCANPQWALSQVSWY